ncbi:MAG: MFS transporter [Chloroflexi bacterium]|nr:MFS transporter [Chloroflexota bacterium]
MMVSIAGTQMQTTTVLWHVNEISGLPLALAGVGLVRILPIVLFSLFAGAVADVINRRHLMFFTQIVLAALAALLGILTHSGRDSLPAIYAVLALSAAASSFDLPARQSLVPNLVPKEILTNAFSLTSISLQVGSIAGPAAAGLVLAKWGIAYAYYLNAFSFLGVIIALLLMGPVDQTRRKDDQGSKAAKPETSLLSSVREGLGFVFNQPIILSSMLLDFFVTFFSNAITLLPIFAKDILFVGVQGYGLLSAAPAVGAGLVAILLSFRSSIGKQGKTIYRAVIGYGLATILFGISRNYWLTFFALAMTGATDGLSAIIRNTIRQIQTPDHLRGRMTSVNQIFFMGGPLLGEVEAGIVAQLFGVTFSVVGGGVGSLLAVAWIAKRFPQLGKYRGDEPILASLP